MKLSWASQSRQVSPCVPYIYWKSYSLATSARRCTAKPVKISILATRKRTLMNISIIPRISRMSSSSQRSGSKSCVLLDRIPLSQRTRISQALFNQMKHRSRDLQKMRLTAPRKVICKIKKKSKVEDKEARVSLYQILKFI